MYEITSNFDEVVAKLRRAIERATRVAELPEVDHIMRQGIRSHFNRLSLGGGSDASALASGHGTTTVRWLVGNRHRFTVASHRIRGVSPSQLLILTGKMHAAYTSGAVVERQGSPGGSDAVLRSGSPMEEEKARVHQTGGQHELSFPLVRQRTLVNVPQRQFIYWDTFMRHGVEKLAIREIEDGWSS